MAISAAPYMRDGEAYCCEGCKALAFEAASAEIVRQAGAQFDPLAVDVFLGEQATLREMAAAQCGEAQLLSGPERIFTSKGSTP